MMEPKAGRFKHEIVPDPQKVGTGTYEFETIASGLQGVWSKENTRESLFDAMRKKETYATTGTRISVRVFGGWDYAAIDVHSPHFVQIGYDKGVPMGGDLKAAADGKAPRLMVQAMKDPDGATSTVYKSLKAGWIKTAKHMNVFTMWHALTIVKSKPGAVKNQLAPQWSRNFQYSCVIKCTLLRIKSGSSQ